MTTANTNTKPTNYPQLFIVSSSSKDCNSELSHSQHTVTTSDNVNTNKMLQQSVNVQAPPPRLHPKKRKFDPSELEDGHHNPPSVPVSSLNAVHSAISSPVIISSKPSSTITLAPTTTVIHHQRIPSDMVATHQNGNQQNALMSTFNPHVQQAVKNTGEVQQIIKRQSFVSFR